MERLSVRGGMERLSMRGGMERCRLNQYILTLTANSHHQTLGNR